MRAELGFPDELLGQKHIPEIGEAIAKERNIFVQRRASLQHQLGVIQEQIAEAERESKATLEQVFLGGLLAAPKNAALPHPDD